MAYQISIINKYIFSAILVMITFTEPVMSEIVMIPMNFRHVYTAQQGPVLPLVVNVSAGHEALLRLTKRLANQQSCTITTSAGQNFTTTTFPDSRYEVWGEGCGIRIKNIQHSDEGRWRLTAQRADHSITGFSTIHVLDSSSAATETPLTLIDGTINQRVSLTDMENAYCLVAKPFSTSTLVAGHCEVQIDRISRALQGTWNVQLGLPGHVAEVSMQTPVVVQAERLDSGFVIDTSVNKLHLYCNLVHSEQNITFCRFQRTSSSQGYNVKDGLGDGYFSYHGEGFKRKECGMTIEHPTAQDYAAWRCAVGVLAQETLLQSALQGLVSVVATNTYGSSAIRSQANHFTRNTGIEDKRTILAVKDAELTVTCEADAPLSYCWFRIENDAGVRDVTPGIRIDNVDQEFWYTGEGLDAGDCGITFANAAYSLAGEWTCHMGPTNIIGLEVTEEIEVRVTGHLAASRPIVSGHIGGSVVLRCQTAGDTRPLNYCRFLTPSSVGLNMASSITANSAIMGRYYFTPGADLHQGECSLTVDPIVAEDIGTWTCAAVVSGETDESVDRIQLEIVTALSIASIVGMAFSAGLLLAGLAVYGTITVLKRQSPSSDHQDIPMQEINSAPRDSNGSSNSGSSSSGFDIRRL